MSDPNLPDGCKITDYDDSHEPNAFNYEPPTVLNIEYMFKFDGQKLPERIHISGGQISWLGENVHQIRSAIEVMERMSKLGDEDHEKRVEHFIDFVCKEFDVEHTKEKYFSDFQTVRMGY